MILENSSIASKKTYFPVLDWIRGIAALSVFAHHFYQQYSDQLDRGIFGALMIHLGAWGVAIFFVLSGFCIHWARLLEMQSSAKFDLRVYATRRFFRIYPLFALSVIFCYFLTQYYSSNLLRQVSILSILSDLTLTSSFIADQRGDRVNNVLWTVVVECHFYILYGLMWHHFSSMKSTLRITIFAIILSGITYLTSVTITGPGNFRVMLQTIFLASWWSWCLGTLVAEFIYRDKKISLILNWNRILFLIFLVLSLMIGILPSPFALQAQRFVLPIAAAAFIYFLLQDHYDFSIAKPMIQLGLMSYSLYLLHPIAILIGTQIGLSALPSAIIIFPLGILFAYLSYRWIEFPFVNIGKDVLIKIRHVEKMSVSTVH